MSTNEWIKPEFFVQASLVLPLRGPATTFRIPLITLLCLVHLGIAHLLIVLDGAGSGNPSGIYDSSLVHHQAWFAEESFSADEDVIAQIVVLEQVAEEQDRGLI